MRLVLYFSAQALACHFWICYEHAGFHKHTLEDFTSSEKKEAGMKKVKLFFVSVMSLMMLFGATMAFAADMTGTWTLDVTSAGGTGSPVFELKQDGDKLSGTYKGRWGEAPATGTVKDDDFVINYSLGGVNVVYKGKVDGNKVSGKVDFGGQGEGTFTGVKK